MNPSNAAAFAVTAAAAKEIPPVSTDSSSTWPHQLSHEPSLRVSDVLEILRPEFPALTSSKLRFLDTNGLVVPHRTPAGYRLYSPACVERLRYVLREQRDHYRPLQVILAALQDLDQGRVQLPITPHALNVHAEVVDAGTLAKLAGVDLSVVEILHQHQLLQPDQPHLYPHDAVALVSAAGRYLHSGGDVLSLRRLWQAAQREQESTWADAAKRRQHEDATEAAGRAAERLQAAAVFFGACVNQESGR